MKIKGIVVLFVFLLLSSLFTGTIALSSTNHEDIIKILEINILNTNTEQATTKAVYPVMKVDSHTIARWKQDYQKEKQTYIDQTLQTVIEQTEDYSILDLLKYEPSERDQHWCGNCWAWPATAVMAIALNIQEGIFDRLSVQYINSCGSKVGVGCCDGGNLNIFTRFYRYTDKAIPWSNENAEWIDKYAQCTTPCESIVTEPNYPISAIYPETIETHEIPEETAIENIKNVLHQQKGVYFSWYLPDMNYREDFSSFWSDEDEETIYALDWDCGATFDEEDGGGHAVLCVGYHDEEGTENDYWIMLNSWGTTNRRPNGLFRVNMHMDYDCSIIFGNQEYYSFDFETLDISFGTEDEAPTSPTIQGPTTGKPNSEYSFEFSSKDYQNDTVFIMIDWGDGETTNWIGPLASEETLIRNHTWTKTDVYIIRAKARDNHGKESLWGNLEVSMTRSKTLPQRWITDFFSHFSLSFLFPR